jgi:hypothetical protein
MGESDLMCDLDADHVTAEFDQALITADIEMTHITFTVEDVE